MIATSVLSVMLLIVSGVLIGIGNLYYKGVNLSRTQQLVRSVTSDIAQQVQYSNYKVIHTSYSLGGGAPTTYVICAGKYRYSYVLDQPLGNDTTKHQIKHVLWRDQNPQPGLCPNSTATPAQKVLLVDLRNDNPYQAGYPGPTNTGSELLSDNMRLSALSISDESPYMIQIGVAYGDDDLLNHTGAFAGLNTTCNGSKGDTYCATATLTTTAERRLQ